MRSKGNKNKVICIVLVCFLFMGIGLAYLSEVLKINGATEIAKTTWDVHFENVVVREGSTGDTLPTIGSDRLSISLSLTLNNPLEFYEYYVDIVNSGSIDAKIGGIVKTVLTPSQQKYLNYTITYKDGIEIKENDLLRAGEKDSIRVLIEYKDIKDANDLPTVAETIEFTGKIDYSQDDGEGVSRSKNSLYQQIVKETQLDTGINLGAISSDTNGKGVYTLDRTVNTANPIYYYRGKVTNNNVIFGSFCWKIIRTTNTGGIKLIYNGIPNQGVCNNTGTDTEIGRSAFNTEDNDPKYVGYMYDDNTKDSTIKGVLDTWFATNLIEYQVYLEDTPFYNERDYVTGDTLAYSFAPRQRIWGNKLDNYAETVPNTTTKLGASEKSDIFTVSGDIGNGALIYPVGLITVDEVVLAGGRGYISSDDVGSNRSYYLYTGSWYWSLSPNFFGSDLVANAFGLYHDIHPLRTPVSESGGVRPVISLKPTTVFLSGDGSSTTPYVIAY